MNIDVAKLGKAYVCVTYMVEEVSSMLTGNEYWR